MQYSAIFFLIEQFFLGLILLRFFDKKNRLNDFEKIIIAAIIGIIAGFFVILLSSLAFKKLETGILAGLSFEFIFLILQAEYFIGFFKEIWRRNARWDFPAIKRFLFYSAFLLPVIYIWKRVALDVLILKDGELQGILVGWGDIAYHFSMIEKFASGGVFAAEQPVFSGAPLTYPFLINFASAVFLKLGVGLEWAFHLPVIILGVLGLAALYLFAIRIFKSAFLAILVLVFVLFGSGLGFLWFFQDAQNAYINSNQPMIETLNNPPHEYTHLDMRTGGKPQDFDAPQNIVWIVPAISFLSHQRSFVWGFALFAALLSLVWLYRDDESLWRLGIIFGAFPLVHGHTFLAISIAGVGWFLWQIWRGKNIRSWIYFGIAGFAVALPALLFLNQSMDFFGAGAGKSFFRWQFGWMACEHNLNWLECVPREGTDASVFYFWSKNFGVVFWIWIAFIISFIFHSAYLKYKKIKEINPSNSERYEFLEWILIPSLLLFAVPNLMILQPWEFDNNKVLYYWWILASFIAAGAIGYAVSLNYFKNKLKIIAIFAAVIVSFAAIFSGAIDVRSRILNSPKNHYGYWGKADKDLAEWVIANTPLDSVFLTDASPTSPISIIAGRSIYLGFPGWLWSQGVNYFPREAKIRKILESDDVNLACNEKIDYILLNTGLQKAYPAMDINFFRTLEIAYQDAPNNIFLVKLNCQNYCKQ